MQHITTDYLVIGAGTSGLAFVDTLIDHSDAHVTIVDRHGKPGGHWNDAYPFVTLHQPSAFYGVNSLALGSGLTDQVGLNRGLAELASGAEINGYFDRVMNQRLLPSGRVAYHPLCNYLGGGVFQSLLTGEKTQVTVRRKTVDANYFGPCVPSTHKRRFEVAPGVLVEPPNALPGLRQQALKKTKGRSRVFLSARGADDGRRPGGAHESTTPVRYVVLGAGKTAMDVCIWLLQSGVSAQGIQWVVPRDSWLVNRITTQNGPEFFDEAIGGQANQMEAFARASSTEDLFLRLEACCALLRIDTTRMPSMFHLATVSPDEVTVLRRLHNIVRLGRVLAVHATRLVLQHGEVPVAPGSLFIDCTASAVEPRATQALFQGDQMVLQMLRLPQPAFSAALAAYVETHFDDDKTKNRLCGPVPFPHTLDDYPRAMLASMWNQFQWGQDKALRQWMRQSRLDGFGKLMASAARDDQHKQAIIARLKDHAAAAIGNLQKLAAA